MSFLFPNIAYVSRPTEPTFKPKIWIADGIRRSIDDKTIEPGDRFVTEADYLKMMKASEDVAVALADHNYKVGRFHGFLRSVGITGVFFILVGLALAVSPFVR
jgi:hypothetical protein